MGISVMAPQTVQRPFFPAALSGAATSTPHWGHFTEIAMRYSLQPFFCD
jgi:hypothetical protein